MTRVAFFSPFSPVPTDSGGRHRVRSILAGLAAAGCETMLMFVRWSPADDWSDARAAELADLGVTRVRPYLLKWYDHRSGRAARALARRFGRAGIAQYAARSPFLVRWARREVRAFAPDIAWLTYADWDPVLSGSPTGVTRVIDSVDLITRFQQCLVRVERDFTAAGPGELPADHPLFREDYFARAGCEADAAEFAVYDRYDYTLAISREEADRIAERSPRTRVLFQPMTVEPVPVANTYDGPAVLVFRGGALGAQGVQFFLTRVLPAVLAAEPGFRVKVVGRGGDTLRPAPGVEPVGYVPDLAPVYAAARLAVVPTFGWTGQQVRVVDAMAHGVPVVALDQVARESPLRHGENGLIARDAGEFADHLVRLWRDRELCRALGGAARATVAAECSSDRLAENLRTILVGSPAACR
jgi:glycosyltransferase involved in cell wall biosynthesis